MSMPPTTTAHFTPMVAPSASNCSDIWATGRRDGEKIPVFNLYIFTYDLLSICICAHFPTHWIYINWVGISIFMHISFLIILMVSWII